MASRSARTRGPTTMPGAVSATVITFVRYHVRDRHSGSRGTLPLDAQGHRRGRPPGGAACRPRARAGAADPLRPQQWGLDLIKADPAHAVSQGAGVTVGVVDTGVKADHEDLAGQVIAGHDCVRQRLDAAGWQRPRHPRLGHHRRHRRQRKGRGGRRARGQDPRRARARRQRVGHRRRRGRRRPLRRRITVPRSSISASAPTCRWTSCWAARPGMPWTTRSPRASSWWQRPATAASRPAGRRPAATSSAWAP